MRFFSKLVFILNVCFILAAILRLVEMAKRSQGNLNAAIPLPAVEGLLVVLGYSAIFINAIYLIVYLFRRVAGKINLAPRWIVLFNLVMFPIQVWYFIFSNF